MDFFLNKIKNNEEIVYFHALLLFLIEFNMNYILFINLNFKKFNLNLI